MFRARGAGVAPIRCAVFRAAVPQQIHALLTGRDICSHAVICFIRAAVGHVGSRTDAENMLLGIIRGIAADRSALSIQHLEIQKVIGAIGIYDIAIFV